MVFSELSQAPAGLTVTNASEPWSEDDLTDPQLLVSERRHPREIAELDR